MAYIVDRLRRMAACKSWKFDLLRFRCRRCLRQVLRKSGGTCCCCSSSLIKVMPEDQLLTAPGRDKGKIIVVATSVGDGVVEGELLFIVIVCGRIMVDGVGGG